MIALLLVFAWAAQNAAQEIPKETASAESKTSDSKAKPEATAPKRGVLYHRFTKFASTKN